MQLISLKLIKLKWNFIILGIQHLSFLFTYIANTLKTAILFANTETLYLAELPSLTGSFQRVATEITFMTCCFIHTYFLHIPFVMSNASLRLNIPLLLPSHQWHKKYVPTTRPASIFNFWNEEILSYYLLFCFMYLKVVQTFVKVSHSPLSHSSRLSRCWVITIIFTCIIAHKEAFSLLRTWTVVLSSMFTPCPYGKFHASISALLTRALCKLFIPTLSFCFEQSGRS